MNCRCCIKPEREPTTESIQSSGFEAAAEPCADIAATTDNGWESSQFTQLENERIDLHQQTQECSDSSKAFKPDNYFLRHWRGDLSLGLSYWANGLFAMTLVGGATSLIFPIGNNSSLKTFAASLLLGYALISLVDVWWLVGIWRSANKHVSRGGRNGWAVAAKIVSGLGALNLIGQLLNHGLPQVSEFVGILAGDTSIPAYQIRILPSGTVVEYVGGLRAGGAKELSKFLDAAPRATVLRIESPGGRLIEAQEIGKLVRARGMTTYTSDYCMSAATLVLMSGKERIMREGAKVGFHSGTSPAFTKNQSGDLNGNLNGILRTTMLKAGVAESFIDRVLETPAEEMWYPTYDEMRQAGVVTSKLP